MDLLTQYIIFVFSKNQNNNSFYENRIFSLIKTPNYKITKHYNIILLTLVLHSHNHPMPLHYFPQPPGPLPATSLHFGPPQSLQGYLAYPVPHRVTFPVSYLWNEWVHESPFEQFLSDAARQTIQN